MKVQVTQHPASLKYLAGLLVVLQIWMPLTAAALPQGEQVVGGQATIQQASPQRLHIQQASDRAILNWQQFSIASGETVQFFQPSVNSVALNRVIGGDPSVILGSLLANGRIFLVNPNGILFGAGAVVNVGGLLATTLRIQDSDFLAGRYNFTRDSADALKSVINQGEIRVSDNGFVALVAPGVSNDGLIVANLGKVLLGSGQRLVLDLMGDGLINYTLSGKVLEQVTGPDGTPLSSAVRNAGTIQADGGLVILSAKASGDIFSSVVNQTGIIQARSLVNHGGVVKLIGGDETLTVATEAGAMRPAGEVSGVVAHTGTIDVSAAEAGATSGFVLLSGERVGQFGTIHARGAENARGGDVIVTSTERTFLSNNSLTDVSGIGNSSAGTVRLWSDRDTFFTAGSTILARGGEVGGNGGFVEVSGKETLGYAGFVDALAPHGAVGTLLLDPMNIILQTVGGVPYAPGVNNLFGNTPAATVTITPASINAQAANVVLQANNDITIANAIAMVNPGVGITMQAGRDIFVNASVSTNNGFISMTANDSAAIAANRTAGTTGDIVFAAGANLSAGTGNITLTIDPSAAAPFSPGSITTVRNLTTTTGNISINSSNTVSLSGAVNAGSGTVTINANTDGAAGQSFTMAAGSSITTTNTTAGAVAINVNAAGGGTGTAALRNITTGSGGTITVQTNTGGNATGGDITQPAGTLNVGSGTVNLSTSTAAGANIGTAAARILTSADTVTASTGTSGVFITETDGANFTATATSAGAINLTSTTGTLTIASATSTGSGAITLSSGDAVALNANVGGAGSGTITINANTNGVGADSFTMNAGSSITTTNTTAGAVTTNVNAAAGGTGEAVLRSITTGSGGRITVGTNTGGNLTGGSITQAAGTLLNSGTGSVVLTTPAAGASGIGTAGANILTTANTITANAGLGGVFITESNGANFTATGTGAGAINLTSTTGTLTIAGATSTGSGAVTLSSVDAVAVNAAVNAGSGMVTINTNTNGAGADSFTMGAAGSISTTNATAGAVAINVNAAGGGTGAAILRNITTGAGGTITVQTDTGGNVTGGDIIRAGATLLNVGTGTVNLSTSTAAGANIGTAAARILTSADTVTASTGTSGVFITETDGANFTATATGAGAINLTSTTGTLTIAGATSTGSGVITITADDVAINAPVSSTGTLTLQPLSPAQTIGIAGGAGGFSLSAAEIANLTDGFSNITIGRANGTGNVTVNTVTFADPVTLRSPSGGTIAVNGQITGAGNASVILNGAATTLGANIVTAGNAITINDPVTLSANATLDSTNASVVPAGANLTVNGTINGAQAFTLQAGTGGAVMLNGTVGGTTPLTSLTVTNAANVTFNGSVATTGNLTQNAGTGTTTLNGASIGGSLALTTNAITLATAPVSVTGGNITLAAASTLTQNANLTAAGAGTINTTTTAGAITMAGTATTSSGTGTINYTAGTDVILGALSTGGAVNVTAQGGSILSAGGTATHVTAGANSTLGALGGVVGTLAMPISVNINPGTLGVAATTQIGGFSGVLTGTVVPSNTLNLLNVPPGCVSFNGACVTPSLQTRGTLVYLNPDAIVPTYYERPSRSITIPRLTSVYVPTSLLEPSDVTILGGSESVAGGPPPSLPSLP